VNSGAFIGWAG